ncbi:putative mRNA capping enzyme large subunit [Alphaentomopoxvirus acuprea]|uniref:mRNA-capping enzyme catalytic subunit n=1 Tax=Alphaentomopoxvirus acuprea TaxID=62099 RepID=W6JL07_9POXV|nr:putative mRNA capping enzyme large subunit [Anomala cuprea entomopoxvirus]BAO49500.1 putative mRNA capping enzyme large subunit [Anomala cuprea entomopoxvirus]
MEYEINVLIKEFIEFYNNVTYIDDDKLHNEVEITYLFPNLILLSNLYQYDECKKTTYLEFSLSYTDNKKRIKFRQIVPYTTQDKFEIKNSYLANKLFNVNKLDIKSEISNKNILLNESNKEKIIFRHSTEKKIIDSDITLPSKQELLKNQVRLTFVNSIRIMIDNLIKIEFKYKANLGSASSNSLALSTYLNNIDTARILTTYYLEIELLSNTKIDNDILINVLNKSFGYIFSIRNLDNFSLSISNEYVPIKTFMITYDKLHIIDKSAYVMTPKINGESVSFYVENGICNITIYNFIYKNINCNINKNVIMSGEGELIIIDNIKHIFPFYFNLIKDNKISYTDRYKQIEFYNTSIINFKSNMKIHFRNKNIFKFESNNTVNEVLKFYRSILINDMYKDINDGVILLDISNNNVKKDYKFKLDNTVDIIAKLETHKGIFRTQKDGLYLTLSLYNYDNKNFVKMLEINLKNEDLTTMIHDKKLISYDNVINMLLFKNVDFGPKILVSPIYCIVEYSFMSSTIIKLRIEKTNKFFRNNYNGNNLNVILSSKQFHEKYNMLSVIDNKLDYMIELNKSNNLLTEETHRSKLILNKDVQNYFLEQTTRTSLNILTNYIKTEAISITVSKLCSIIPNRHVLSIDIGRGGDLRKYYYVGISGMLGTEPDISALETARSRYKEFQISSRAKSSVYKFNSINISILDDNYINRVKEIYLIPQRIKFFGVIEWQLAIHYSYNEDTKNNILYKLKNLAGDGTKIIITCLNGDLLSEKLQNNPHLNYKISDTIYYKISKIDDNRISVLYNATMSTWLEEFLIKKTIINDFKNYNFVLDDIFTFDKIFNNDINKMLRVLAVFNRKSTKDFYSNIINDKNIYENKELQELLSFFIVYIFRYSSSLT